MLTVWGLERRAYAPKSRHCVTLQSFALCERVTGVNHNTVIRWVRKSAVALPDAPRVEEIPEITEIDELQTYIGQKKQDLAQQLSLQATLVASSSFARAITANHWKPGILTWVLGERSAQTFEPLWKIIRGWESFLYVTDGWLVYPRFINDCDHLVLKTYMTRIEGENTRLRHCAHGAHRYCFAMANRHTSIARLKRKTLCYSKCEQMLPCIN